VTDTLKLQTTSYISSARLYSGDTESERDSLYNELGEVEVSTIGSSVKPGPNEDSAAVIPIDKQALVLIVADGVGGLAGGRAASNMAVDEMKKALKGATAENLRTAILDGIETANAKILTQGKGNATTITVAEVRPGSIRSYHVGDSAIWVCGQRGKVKLQTTAHSPVGFAVEAGLLKETEALNHDHLHLISNVVGSADMRIEIGSELPIASRDTLLLASDGLFDNLMQHEIVRIIRKGPLNQAMTAVTDLSLKRMHEPTAGRPSKHDDFTAILYRQPPKKRKPRAKRAKPDKPEAEPSGK